jgi:hypothetical protein
VITIKPPGPSTQDRSRSAHGPARRGGARLSEYGRHSAQQGERAQAGVDAAVGAQVRYRDMYSLRWTFVSLARASGEAAFNVSRVIGHARSTIVDTIYAHAVDSALAGASESVAERIGLTLPTPPAAPEPATAPRQPPKLSVIEGGRRAEGDDQRDIGRTRDPRRDRPVWTSASMSEDDREPHESAIYPLSVHLQRCPVSAGH